MVFKIRMDIYAVWMLNVSKGSLTSEYIKVLLTLLFLLFNPNAKNVINATQSQTQKEREKCIFACSGYFMAKCYM